MGTFKDFFFDGHKAVRIISPALSASFSLYKFFGGNFLNIQEMSYAWALLPLLIWAISAYVTRYQIWKALKKDYEIIEKKYEKDCGEDRQRELYNQKATADGLRSISKRLK